LTTKLGSFNEVSESLFIIFCMLTCHTHIQYDMTCYSVTWNWTKKLHKYPNY